MVFKKFKKLLQFRGVKYSHLTNQEEEQEITPPIMNTGGALHSNCLFLIFGSSGSGKTSFVKHYLDQTKSDNSFFGRDENEFHEQNFVHLLQFKKFDIESLANKTTIIDNAGAYENKRRRYIPVW